MILAAGFGTRMGALTADRPKPLIEVAGRALLDHALDAVAGCAPVVVNAHYRAEQIAAHLRERPGAMLSREDHGILDSGGGIKQALPMLGRGPIATVNADAVWKGPQPIEVLRAAWRPEEMEALLLLVPRARAVARQGGGDFGMAACGRLSWDKSESGIVYTGAQIIKTERIAAHPARVFSLRDIWQAMMEGQRLFGVTYPGLWADVGHPEGIAEAEGMVRDD